MSKNKRKMLTIVNVLLIIILITITLMYFNTQENNTEIKSSLKEYNAELEENEHMHLEEDSSGDKVPVPNGYVGSKATGENEIDTGYVIYEGTEEVNNENVEEAQKTRNQYVWIPVPDASQMYGTDENGKKWGKLYEFTTDTGENIDPITGAKPLNWNESNGVFSIITKTGDAEPNISPRVIDSAADMDSRIKKENIGAEDTHEFLIQLEQEFCEMIESIEKYKGFYVGRYETGDLSKDNSVIRKYNQDIASQTWYIMYKKCKNLNNENANITTGIIWGSQWNRVLMWLIESENKSKEEICKDSTSWGNYRDSEFEYTNDKEESNLKLKNSEVTIPTGGAEYTKANNIYDLAGNVSDLTMTVSNSLYKQYRGGNYQDKENSENATAVTKMYPYQTFKYARLQSNAVYKIVYLIFIQITCFINK